MWHQWDTKSPRIKNILTGIVGEYDWEKRIDLVTFLRPDLSSFILPYTPPFDGNYAEINAAVNALKKRNLFVRTVPIELNSDITQKVLPFLHEADVLLLMRDATVLCAKDQLIKHCNQEGVTIFTGEIESIKSGAASGLCIDERDMGVYPAHQTIDILAIGKPIADLPIMNIGDNGTRFVINKQALKSQNITLNNDHLFLIENGIIIRNNKDTES